MQRSPRPTVSMTILRPVPIFPLERAASVETAYRRWLGYVLRLYPAEAALVPENRITPTRVAEFVAHLKTTVRDTSVATVLDGLHYAARLIAPRRDWAWLKSVQRRIHAAAIPLDRLDQLQPPSKTLDLGLTMMDEARAQDPDPHHLQDVRYRDGLVIALLSLWPIRRRSITALTVSRHLVRQGDQFRINLFPEDTKARRAETFPVPNLLRPYLEHYLSVTRPGLMRHHRHDALWVSQRGTPCRRTEFTRLRASTSAMTLESPWACMTSGGPQAHSSPLRLPG